ncbi:hypothetical protein SCOR_09950 [Sulfidibacter corallicola]|uniref:Uncharacterized protein n=1 Tax=Sulfidibacter corallicola TaxID=2818388 RepID=A0A8A4TWM6_SULCO|nr:hypothetical protein [Sulfidibacter corallicola]QTD50925.1 hypothetical protein J3U87_00520 [Sulfidibacter corallicola]
MGLFLLFWWLQVKSPAPWDDAHVLQVLWQQKGAEAEWMRAYLTGQWSLHDLRAAAVRRSVPERSLPKRGDGGLPDVAIPEGSAMGFYGGDALCDGPGVPMAHPFLIPSYITILYQRLVYDPGVAAWTDERHGVDGDVGVVYRGFVQRIWGHGFFIEMETDPLGGVHQRVDLIHFREEDCHPDPLIEIPCIRDKSLYTFTWAVRDGTYQIRRAKPGWRDVPQLTDFYVPAQHVQVAGTPCIEMRALQGIDAGYYEGSNSIWTTAPDFPFTPCGDFPFDLFHLITQRRWNPWPGSGMPLLSFTAANPTDKQRDRTMADFEVARAPTALDEEAGFDPELLGADRHTQLLDTDDYAQRATREARARLAQLEAELMQLGESFPDSPLAGFARFASRNVDPDHVLYLYDLADADQLTTLREMFPAWVGETILGKPDRGFTHEVAVWFDVDWRPPWESEQYEVAFNHPNEIIPYLDNLDAELVAQGEQTKAIVTTTDLVDRYDDTQRASGWPQWGWPDIENPDTYWTIYLTWR